MCVLCHTGGVLNVEVNNEAASALSSIYQLNNHYSNLECFISDEASEDQAVKCCTGDHHSHYGRRRCKNVETTATNRQSM